jgi:hypothetical protein
MPRAEVRTGPAVESAGFGMPDGQGRDGNGERDQEEDRREQPEENRTGAGMGG